MGFLDKLLGRAPKAEQSSPAPAAAEQAHSHDEHDGHSHEEHDDSHHEGGEEPSEEG